MVDRLGTFSCDLEGMEETRQRTSERKELRDLPRCCKAAVEGLLLRIWRTMLSEMSNRSLNLLEVDERLEKVHESIEESEQVQTT